MEGELPCRGDGSAEVEVFDASIFVIPQWYPVFPPQDCAYCAA